MNRPESVSVAAISPSAIDLPSTHSVDITEWVQGRIAVSPAD